MSLLTDILTEMDSIWQGSDLVSSPLTQRRGHVNGSWSTHFGGSTSNDWKVEVKEYLVPCEDTTDGTVDLSQQFSKLMDDRLYQEIMARIHGRDHSPLTWLHFEKTRRQKEGLSPRRNEWGNPYTFWSGDITLDLLSAQMKQELSQLSPAAAEGEGR